MKNKAGFTLVEVMIVVVILAVVLTGMVRLYVYTSVQAELAGNKTRAVSEAQTKIEEIREHDYSSIVADYASGGTPGDTFGIDAINGMGKIYIDNSVPELLEIEIVVSWQDQHGRLIGEDADLDGVLDGGEDTNGNGQLDSPIRLITLLTRK